jgi:hypothetical protein
MLSGSGSSGLGDITMKKITLFVMLALAVFALVAAIPADASLSDGTDRAGSAVVLLGKDPKMCYDQVFKVWYECYGRGLKNKYPWLSDKDLKKKAEKMLEDPEFGWATSCKRVWEEFPGGYYVYTCRWKGDIPTKYRVKYYY